MRLLVAVSILFPVSALYAQTTQPCSSLKSLQIPASSIALATQGATVTSARSTHAGSLRFCKVLGEIKSIDPTANPISFEVNLPTPWNGKAVHFGGGTFDGNLRVAGGTRTPELGIRRDPTPLERGYATFGSDSGHHHHYFVLPDVYNAIRPNFALNLEQRRNFAHDGLKKTHDAALYLITRFYGTPPKHMFFLGGSTGGREAYAVTQRWPQDYDGVLAGYAAWNQVQLDLQFIRVSEAEYKTGDKFTRGWVPNQKTRLVANSVMKTCDAQDGVRDGIISDPAACHFDLATLACPAGKVSRGCLTPGQLNTFTTFATEQRTALPLANGVDHIPGYNITSGVDLSGSMGFLRHPFHPPIVVLNSFYYLVADGVLRFFLSENPHFDVLKFDTSTGGFYARDLMPQSLESDASNADLTPFVNHGGRLILVHGTSDPIVPTNASVQFYKMMQAKMPQSTIDQGVRFYLVPGFGHASGVFNAGFDALGALDRWVETGKAPEHLVVTDNNRRQHRRTRPLCQWPAYPHYVSGDVNLASSFACAQPS